MDYESNNISIIRRTFEENPDVSILTLRPFRNLLCPHILSSVSKKYVSLTLDVLDNKGKENEKWGFVEVSNPDVDTEEISNGFCFGGQTIWFYIKAEEYSDSVTSINISSFDIVDLPTETTIKQFDDLNSNINDDSRYFSWTVPEVNSALFAQTGLFGLVVLKATIARTINGQTYNHQAIIQLLIYSAGREALDVSSSLFSILNDTSFTETTTLSNLFSHLTISNFEDVNMPLTDLQKQSLVADQIAVLFIAQHAVLPADYVPSKILGFGAEASITTESIRNRISQYSQKYPDAVPMALNRLYGMLANYKRYNFIDDLNNSFSSFTQSNQYLLDPQKTVVIDETGNVASSIGNEGLFLNPYSLEITEAEVLRNIPDPKVFTLDLTENDVEIGNITITDANGSSITSGTYFVNVAFDVFSGASNIDKITYYLWTSNNLNYLEHIDNSGLTRARMFDLTNYGNVYVTNTVSDVIYTRIEALSTNGVSNIFNAEVLAATNVNSGIVTLQAIQRDDGSSYVDIFYDYQGFSEIDNSTVTISISQDDGTTWTSISSTYLQGDFGYGISSGNKRIVWAPLGFDNSLTTSYEDYVLIQLTITDVDGNTNTGKSQCTAVLNFTKPEVYIRRLSDKEEYDYAYSSSSESSSSSYSSF